MKRNLQHIRPLTLPTLCAQHARIRSTLATGLTLPFTRAGVTGHLQLALANEYRLAEESPSPETYVWRSDIGPFSLHDPFPVLSLLSACPLLPVAEENDDAAQAWYWTLYNQSLNPVLRAIFGEIYPLDFSMNGKIQEKSAQDERHSAEQCDPAAALCAWFSVSWNGMTVRSRMQAADAVWLTLLSRTHWLHQCHTLPTGMAIEIPLTLADIVLPLTALQPLQVGDLLLPNRPWFSLTGEGTLSSGMLRLHGALHLTEHAPYTFTVTDMETVSMPSSATDSQFAATLSDTSTSEFTSISDSVTDALPPLPVTLHLRCGSLTMTLTELQHLARGSVLTLRDVVPGQAWLYHGDTVLASGDLVDVEGRLGLQITARFSVPTPTLPMRDGENAAEPELAP